MPKRSTRYSAEALITLEVTRTELISSTSRGRQEATKMLDMTQSCSPGMQTAIDMMRERQMKIDLFKQYRWETPLSESKVKNTWYTSSVPRVNTQPNKNVSGCFHSLPSLGIYIAIHRKPNPYIL